MTTPRGSWALRDRPGVVWLTLAVLLALVHPFVPGSQWLMVHLVLLGALTHSAMVWSTHFTQALLKTPASIDDRTQQNRRIGLLVGGVSAVLVGVPTSLWPLTVLGATAVSAAILWHGVQLWRRLRRALPGRFRVTVRYYLAAAALVPVGAGLGAWLARGLGDELHGRVIVAHSMVMVLGWLGLTVTGTLVTLWPTMLRTRMDDRAERLARQALPVLLGSVSVLALAATLGSRAGALVAILGYAGGLAWWGRALVAPARHAPPRSFATWSVTAALAWAVVGLALVAWRIATTSSWGEVGDGYGLVAAVLAVGFAAQLLTGALSHLIPTVLGGGPSVVRAASEWFNRGAVWRVSVINLGLVTCLLSAGWVRVAVSVLVLGALAAFIPLMFGGIRAAVSARRALLAAVAEPGSRPARLEPEPRVWSSAQLVGAVAGVALAVSLGAAADPASVGLASASGSGSLAAGAASGPVAATGETTRVRVEAHDMRYSPSSIEVPYGDRLVIDLVNLDEGSPHDLSFGDDLTTPRIMPGGSATLDVGVIGSRGQGWCTIVGHRQMGMVLGVAVRGGPEPGTTSAGAGGDSASAGEAGSAEVAAPGIRLGQPAPADFRAVDATLPPLTDERTHEVTLTVEEVDLEVAPGVHQKRWTYNGSVPAPTLHGRVGDTFVVTLVNHGSMGHSIDFHAGERAPDEVMRTVPPGESLTYRFTATRAGIWMYHCSTMPMSAHIAAGMHGAVVIEPDGLPPVDHSYVLVQSEVHVGGDGVDPVREVDAASAAADTPDAVVFNGVANQYDARPLTARTGERVRLWVLAAGPNRGTSFHVVGGQFDTVWSEGAYRLRPQAAGTGEDPGGGQVLGLSTAQGGFVELSLPEPGHYPFVDHVMANAEKGARGILLVTD